MQSSLAYLRKASLFVLLARWMQYPPDHPRLAPPFFSLAEVSFPYHGFCVGCVRSAPPGFLPVRERLSLQNLCPLCTHLVRLRTLLCRLHREHELFFFILDQLQLFAEHVSRTLRGPPGHEFLERFLLVYNLAPVSSGTRSVIPNGALIIYTSSEEEAPGESEDP